MHQTVTLIEKGSMFFIRDYETSRSCKLNVTIGQKHVRYSVKTNRKAFARDLDPDKPAYTALFRHFFMKTCAGKDNFCDRI